jgi:hypothetical protein
MAPEGLSPHLASPQAKSIFSGAQYCEGKGSLLVAHAGCTAVLEPHFLLWTGGPAVSTAEKANMVLSDYLTLFALIGPDTTSMYSPQP